MCTDSGQRKYLFPHEWSKEPDSTRGGGGFGLMFSDKV